MVNEIRYEQCLLSDGHFWRSYEYGLSYLLHWWRNDYIYDRCVYCQVVRPRRARSPRI